MQMLPYQYLTSSVGLYFSKHLQYSEAHANEMTENLSDINFIINLRLEGGEASLACRQNSKMVPPA